VNTTAEESISQNNSTNIDKQNIIVTWLETNKTKTSSVPMIMVSDEDFWMVFDLCLNKQLMDPEAHLSSFKMSKQ
jgi:hypothetical protein